MQKRKKVPYTVKGFLSWVAKQRGRYCYGNNKKCPNARFHHAAGQVYSVHEAYFVHKIGARTRLIDAIETLAVKSDETYPALAERAKAVRAWRRKPVSRAA